MKDDGEGYFQFLREMKKIWKNLDEVIKDLQHKYDKTATRIIDEYNWCTYNPKCSENT